MKLWLAILLVLVLLAPTPSGKASETDAQSGMQTYFDIHVDKWMALHHFAYHAARSLADKEPRGLVKLDASDRSLLETEAASFASLADAYAPYMYRSILHDEDTRSIAQALVAGPDKLTDPALQQALQDFMPTYEEHFWPRHREASQQVATDLSLLLKQRGAAMARRLTGYFEQDWPAQPIRVDIVPYANWAGAYTDNDPAHITLGANDRDIVAYAFEMVFHEASHTSPLGDSIDAAAEQALRSVGLSSDPSASRYWHYLLFYASGRAASETLDDPGYVPYADATGKTSLPGAAPYYEALEATWEQEETLVERATAAARMVAASLPEEAE